MHPLTATCFLALVLGATAMPVSADLGEPPLHALDVDGALLVGTYPAAVGKLDDGDPIPDMGLDPVSRAIWEFTTQPCFLYAEVIMTYRTEPGNDTLVSEEAILRVRLVDNDGMVKGDWLATGGHLHRVHDEPLATNQTYTVEVHHMVGPRVVYDLDVWLHHGCS
ncbi:MAG: hypothetical protein KY455_00350 [Euryarchaeota archaeon]|nr:hypothetical protein [Euryarchaeota archaeon]